MRYELKNFRGDVRQVISDVKYREEVNGVVEYTADVYQVADSYPFGWAIAERTFSAGEEYRYGFNGKENDRDFGDQLIQDYGFRLYNPSIGRFLSVDPLAPTYPFYTPYQFAGNTPIQAIDLDGLEEYKIVDNLTKDDKVFHTIIYLPNNKKIEKNVTYESVNGYKDGNYNTFPKSNREKDEKIAKALKDNYNRKKGSNTIAHGYIITDPIIDEMPLVKEDEKVITTIDTEDDLAAILQS